MTSAMLNKPFVFPDPRPLVVGSIGDMAALNGCEACLLPDECDLTEIRIDLIYEEFKKNGPDLWRHLESFPILFTARRECEGSPVNLRADERVDALLAALPYAALIDIEVSSIQEMGAVIEAASTQMVPWIASFHDFNKLPTRSVLEKNVNAAREAGAAAFKIAAQLETLEDLTALTHFQVSEQGIPLATMGMGVLGPVSRLLCAQAGSVLNYGYLGVCSTAPGQWSARQLRDGIRSLRPFTNHFYNA